MKMMEKLMSKKDKGEELDPMYKSSKMSMLQSLRDEMSGMMKDDLSPEKMSKVTVAGDSPEAVEMGLDKAKGMLGGKEGVSEDTGVEMAMQKYLDMPSAENIEALIACLEQQKLKASGDDEEGDDEADKFGFGG